MSGRLKASLVRMSNIHLRPLPQLHLQLHFIAFVVLGIRGSMIFWFSITFSLIIIIKIDLTMIMVMSLISNEDL